MPSSSFPLIFIQWDTDKQGFHTIIPPSFSRIELCDGSSPTPKICKSLKIGNEIFALGDLIIYNDKEAVILAIYEDLNCTSDTGIWSTTDSFLQVVHQSNYLNENIKTILTKLQKLDIIQSLEFNLFPSIIYPSDLDFLKQLP